MNENTMIPATDFCTSHQIELSVLFLLHESQLVTIEQTEQEILIPESELPRLEMFVRLHRDLEINIAGIESITHLLETIESLQKQVILLSNQLST